MMNKYKHLLKMQLYNLFGINRLLHSHDKKEKQRFVIVGILGVLTVAILLIYTTRFSNNIVKAGFGEALPTLMVVICSLTSLTLTFLKSTGVIIGLKDYDMVMSMPVNTISIVASRITMLYLTNLIIEFVIMIPSGIIYIVDIHPSVNYYCFLIGTLLFTPIIPMIFSLALGVLIVAISSHSKHKNIFSLLLSTLAVLLIVFASTKAQSMNTSQITDMGVAMAESFNKFYPPAALITSTFLKNDWKSFILFILISFVLGIVFIGITSHFYKTLNTSVFSHYVKKNYKMRELKSSSPFMALYKKEFSRLTSCTIYALNSCIGIVLMLVLAVMTVFFMPATLKTQLETMGIMEIVQNIMPVILAIFVSMTSTTAAALSLEGKNRWIMCSVPIQKRTIYNSKIAVNLTVILPLLYVSIFLLGIAFPCSIIRMALMFILPTAYAFFISVLGIYLNIKFPKYDWTSEYYAVKGGAISVLATIGGGMASSLIPLYLCLIFSQYQILIMLSDTGLVLIATLTVYYKVCKTELYI